MNVFFDIRSIQDFLGERRKNHIRTGLVPTMGALHDGHLSLIEASQRENDLTVCSIFVNPVQFNNPEDLKKYPRDLEKDIEKLKMLKVQAVFCPPEDVMYPEPPLLTTSMGTLDEVMEGKFRPGHFNGVRIIVAKLFNIIRPDRSYFGQKDLQQFIVIKKLNEILNFGIELKCVETVREGNGLAMSSRNRLLTEDQKVSAALIHRTLREAKANLLSGTSVEEVVAEVTKSFEAYDADIRLEYFEVVDTDTLQNVVRILRPEKCALCIAAYVGKVRLIDNISLI